MTVPTGLREVYRGARCAKVTDGSLRLGTIRDICPVGGGMSAKPSGWRPHEWVPQPCAPRLTPRVGSRRNRPSPPHTFDRDSLVKLMLWCAPERARGPAPPTLGVPKTPPKVRLCGAQQPAQPRNGWDNDALRRRQDVHDLSRWRRSPARHGADRVTSHGDRHLVLAEEHAILLPTADGFAVVDIDAL